MSGSRSAGWSVASLAMRLVIAVAVAAALGFPIFAWSLDRKPVQPAKADGIVVLTGGAERLDAAVKLLEQGKAARLLISGVHQETTRHELQQRIAADPSLFACCVDLGRSAANTIGNAGETAAWVNENRYASIIVVTASYHMPRTLLELQAVMPDTRLVAYPVFPDPVQLDRWWSDPQTTGVLIAEYGKYLAAFVRVSAATTFGLKTAAAPESPTIERGTQPVAASAPDTAAAGIQ